MPGDTSSTDTEQTSQAHQQQKDSMQLSPACFH